MAAPSSRYSSERRCAGGRCIAKPSSASDRGSLAPTCHVRCGAFTAVRMRGILKAFVGAVPGAARTTPSIIACLHRARRMRRAIIRAWPTPPAPRTQARARDLPADRGGGPRPPRGVRALAREGAHARRSVACAVVQRRGARRVQHEPLVMAGVGLRLPEPVHRHDGVARRHHDRRRAHLGRALPPVGCGSVSTSASSAPGVRGLAHLHEHLRARRAVPVVHAHVGRDHPPCSGR